MKIDVEQIKVKSILRKDFGDGETQNLHEGKRHDRVSHHGVSRGVENTSSILNRSLGYPAIQNYHTR